MLPKISVPLSLRNFVLVLKKFCGFISSLQALMQSMYSKGMGAEYHNENYILLAVMY
jgi:hypothetical protein